MLPHVIRFNAQVGNPYSDLMADADALAKRIEHMLQAAGLPTRLTELEVQRGAIPALAAAAAKQWTATFNPRQVGESDFLSIYRSAYG
jgi:alcohol dehydrogenase